MKNIAKVLCFVLSLVLVISVMGVITFADETAAEPTGTLSGAYTSGNTIWGECGGNATESFELRVYSGDEYLGSTSLNNVDGIIDGDVYVTWSINFAGESSDHWTVDWTIYPRADLLPTTVEQWIDGVKVAEVPVQYNNPDNVNKIVAATVDEYDRIVSFYSSLSDAMANNVSGRILLLADVKENIGSFTDVSLFTYNESGVTVTSTYTSNYVDFDNATVGYGVTLNVKDLYSGGSMNNIDGTVNVSGDYKLGYDATTNISGELNVAGSLNVFENDEYTYALNVYGTLNCGTLNITSGTVSGFWATVTLGNLVANVESGVNISLDESVVTIANVNVHADLDFKVVDNGDGTYSFVAKQYVAQIGDKKYESLQDAINAAGEGDTIVLLDNVYSYLDVTEFTAKHGDDDAAFFIPAGKKITIDLNGCEIYVTAVLPDGETHKHSGAILNYGELTIDDSCGGGRIAFEYIGEYDNGYKRHGAILNLNTVIVNGGTVENLTALSSQPAIDSTNYGKTNVYVVINGGTVRSAGFYAIDMVGYYDFAPALYNNLTVNGGVIEGGVLARVQANTNLNLVVTDGIISNDDGYAVYYYVYYAGCEYSASITGGTFVSPEGTDSIYVRINPDETLGAFISGGHFTSDVSAHCVAGLKTVQMADGTYGIAKNTDTPYVGENLNWWIGDVDTGFLAVPTIEIQDGYWVINGVVTDYRAETINGHSPKVTIGADGYWYIDDVKTETRAQAYNGVGVSEIIWREDLSHDNIMTYEIKFTHGLDSVFFHVTNGRDGDQGLTGAQGPAGIQGEMGDQGANGFDGEDASGVVTVAVIAAAVSLLVAIAFLVYRKKNPYLFH